MKEKIFKLKHDSNGDTMMNTLVSSAPPPGRGEKKAFKKQEMKRKMKKEI